MSFYFYAGVVYILHISEEKKRKKISSNLQKNSSPMNQMTSPFPIGIEMHVHVISFLMTFLLNQRSLKLRIGVGSFTDACSLDLVGRKWSVNSENLSFKIFISYGNFHRAISMEQKDPNGGVSSSIWFLHLLLLPPGGRFHLWAEGGWTPWWSTVRITSVSRSLSPCSCSLI